MVSPGAQLMKILRVMFITSLGALCVAVLIVFKGYSVLGGMPINSQRWMNKLELFWLEAVYGAEDERLIPLLKTGADLLSGNYGNYSSDKSHIDCAQASAKYRHIIRIKTAASGPESLAAAEAYLDMGKKLRHKCVVLEEESQEAVAKALQIAERVHGSDSDYLLPFLDALTLPTVLSDVPRVVSTGERLVTEKEIDIFNRIKRIAGNSAAPDYVLLTRALANLVSLYERKGNFEQARLNLNVLEEVSRKIFSEGSAELEKFIVFKKRIETRLNYSEARLKDKNKLK